MSELAARSAVHPGEGGPDDHGSHGGHADLYDAEGSKIGMWLFLFTEVLLFGALFIAYAVYLYEYTWQFRKGSHELSVPIGAANTLVLLTSSMTMALSIATLERGKTRLSHYLMDFTLLCGLAFLVVKGFEWGAKIEHGLYPGSPHLEDLTMGENVFFGLYYTMTGLHALHIVFGMAIILCAKRLVHKGRVNAERIVFLENTGLYWHLVDMVWIFLFPLFYLIG